jgi:hypothetical protein
MHGAGLLVFADKSQQQIKLRTGQSTRFASQVAAKARPTEKLINEFNGDHKSPSEQQTVNSGRLKAEAEERMETEIRDQRSESIFHIIGRDLALFPIWGYILVALVSFILICNVSEQRQQQAKAADPASIAREAQFQRALTASIELRARMRDPDSFEIASALVLADNTVCIEYRSRNGFGGMDSGNAVYIAPLLASQPGADLRELWHKSCAGKSGVELVDDVNAGLKQYDKLYGSTSK